ncbi:hypothetical protein AKJ64_00915 [candidate division MSBL1 archaeon SCGC-AAA259E17]|uniref:Adenine DNA glycosylase n=1 Tax=candidate division MSBL1 archaeon SCGC-AAA259E17 TaxID=1698263 RepID=A0A133UGS8_9EURY|nr:hypothetical protein AKJ64_00915 [candidate division MSBL1 archaeon SCGC-AAA259E17]
MEKIEKIQSKLLGWYEEGGRKSLPWRKNQDPYRVLIAEVLLRKTRVEQALPVFKKVVKRYPGPKALSESDLNDLRNLIGPIGLVSRVRNLKEIGREITSSHNCNVPSSFENLKKLPGVGRYIASSVLCFGFGEDRAIVDGNVSRVYSRFFGRSKKSDASRDEDMWAFAQKVIPEGHAKCYNASLLDLGALVCTHHDPSCDECPLREDCNHISIGSE